MPNWLAQFVEWAKKDPCYNLNLVYKYQPVSKNKSWQARSVLINLHELRKRQYGRVLVGQHLAPWKETFDQAYGESVAPLPKKPALLSVDYARSYDHYKGGGLAALTDMNKGLIKHAKTPPCGIVSITWHAVNPWTGGGEGGEYAGPTGKDDIWNFNTPAGSTWQMELERVAVGLKQLWNAGVPVLFRPLHEMNAPWFWWGYGDAPSPTDRAKLFKAMWNKIFAYFTVTKGLSNLLWVWSPAIDTGVSGIASPELFYPGHDKVDVVALDCYTDTYDAGSSYLKVIDVAGGQKPFGFAEYGAILDGAKSTATNMDNRFDQTAWADRLSFPYKEAVFATAWVSDDKNKFSLVDTKCCKEFLDHGVTRTLGLGLKELKAT